jgi:surface protein
MYKIYLKARVNLQMQKIFAKKAALLVLVLIFALSVSAQNLFLEETTFSVGEDIAIFSSSSGTLKAMEINGESQLIFDALENQTTTFSLNKPGEYVVTLTQNDAVTDFLTFSIVDLQAKEILTIDKHTAILGETVIIAVHSLELTSYRLFYEYQGKTQKYSGDLSLISFSTQKPGTHTFILKDLQDTEIARESIEITPNDAQPEITEPTVPAEPQSETETQPKTQPKLLDQIPQGLSFKGTIHITDSKKKNVDYKIQSRMDRGSYDVAIEFINSSVKKIAFEDVPSQAIKFGVDEIPTEKTSIEDVKSYAINPESVNFTNATVTAVASPNARELYKCKDYNFTSQTCYGNWVKIADITPGEEYSFTLTPEDPAFAEVGVASINTRKSTYRPGEAAEIIAVILDNQGYLVENANVTIEVIDPNGTTHNLESFKTSKGIYEASYTVKIEGLHLIRVEAMGAGVNNSMQSHFMSSTNYSFDIIRTYPATIDPWQGPYAASLQVISYVPDASFTLTESLPANFTVGVTGSAQVVYTPNATLLSWTVTNNSIVAYSANAPLITPDLYSVGPAKITYSAGEFQEARPWYLAIDPLINSTNQQSGAIQYLAENYTTRVVDEVFEGALTNWTNGTGWQTQTGTVFAGSRSMGKIAGSAVGNLTMKGVETNGSRKVLVQFAMYDNNLDAGGDLLLFFNDSAGNWDQIVDLATFSAVEEAWVPYSINITDPQYFHSGFALRFVNNVALTTGGGGENFYLDNVIIMSETEDTNANKSFTTYTDVISDSASVYVNNITVTIQVSSYDNSGSTGRSNTNSDIMLEMYNGSQYIQIGGFGITGTGNYTKVIRSQGVNQSILNAWSAVNNRDMRVFGSYLDTNTTQLDQISYTGLWATLDYNFSGLVLYEPNVSRDNPLNGTYISVSVNITAINNSVNTARAIVSYPNGTNYQNYSLRQQASTTIYYNDSILVPSYPFGNYTISIWANDSTAVNYASSIPAQFAPVWTINQSATISIDGAINDWNPTYFVIDGASDPASFDLSTLNQNWTHLRANALGTGATTNTAPRNISILHANITVEGFLGLGGAYEFAPIWNGYTYLIESQYQLLSSNVSKVFAIGNFSGTNSPIVGTGTVYVGDQSYLYYYNGSNISHLIAQALIDDAFLEGIYPHIADENFLFIREFNDEYQYNMSNSSNIGIVDGSNGFQLGYVAYNTQHIYYTNTLGTLYQSNSVFIGDNFTQFSAGGDIGQPAISGDYVYVVADQLYQLNASNISQVIANFSLTNFTAVPLHPAVSGGYVYVAGSNGNLYQLNASNITRIINNFSINNNFSSSPVVASGYVFVGGGDDQLYQLNAANISRVIANRSNSSGVITVANGYVYVRRNGVTLLQLGEGDASALEIVNTSLAHNSTNLHALISTTSSIDTNAKYRIYLSNNSKGNNTSPDGNVLPFNYTALIQVNNSACHIYNWTGSVLGNCSYSNNSYAIEVSSALSTLGLSQGNYTNVTFETAKSGTRYDMAPDMSSFVQYYVSPVPSTSIVVNINVSQNNTLTSDNTPTIAFNVTVSGTSSCTLYFNNVGYNYTTGIAPETNILITANSSVPDGNYLVSINCTQGLLSNVSDYLNYAIDTTSPSISNVLNWNTTNVSVIINWTTDEAANGSVTYGTTSELLDGNAYHTNLLTTHNLTITGLSPGTIYYYIINSCDALNNCDITGFNTFATRSLTAVNINTSQNNTFTTDSTPTIAFNASADSLVNCTLYFNNVGYNYTTGLNPNSNILITANSSIAAGNYLVNVNCTDSIITYSSAYLNYTIDTEGPSVVFNNPADNSYYSSLSTIVLNVTVVDSLTRPDVVFFNITNASTSFIRIASNTSSTEWNASITVAELSQGSHVIRAFVNDTVGNNNYTSSVSITVDTQAPTVVLLNTSINTTYTTPGFTFNFIDGTSPTAACALYIGSTGYNYTSSVANNTNTDVVANSTVADGSYITSVNCTDVYGNTGASNSITVKIDTTPPVATITSPSNNQHYNSNATIEINGTVSDITLGVQNVYFAISNSSSTYYLNASNRTATLWNASLDLALMDEGYHTITLFANDSLGNTNSSSSITFIKDTVAPIVNLHNLSFNTNDRTPGFTFNFTDDVSSTASCNLTLNSVTYNYTTSLLNNTNIELTVNSSLPDDLYGAYIMCVDESENLGQSGIAVFVDATPPQATITYPTYGTNFTTNSIINLNATVYDEFAVFSVVFLATNGSTNVFSYATNVSAINWTSNLSLSSLGDGNITITLIANDSLQNTNATSSVTILKDTTGPVINILNTTFTTNDNTPAITFNASDATSTIVNCTLNFDSIAYNFTQNPQENTNIEFVSNTTLADSTYNVDVTCTDLFGHSTTSNTIKITINTAPPAIGAVLNWSINRTDVKINWTTDEEANGSIMYGTTLSMSTGNTGHANFLTIHNINITGLVFNTLYYYNVTSCDALGNCNTSGPYNFTTSDYSGPAFAALWTTSQTSAGSSNSTTISLPLYNGGTYDFNVDWGDGSNSAVTSYNDPDRNHSYATAGTYNVNITGTIIGFRFNNAGDRLKIGKILQWGVLNLGNNGSYFFGASNLNSTATDALNLTGTTNLSETFRSATIFNGNISNWDTSQVTDMTGMFRSTNAFNQNIGGWDLGNVTSMRSMFSSALAFNQNLTLWNTGKVNNMNSMFFGAASFKGNISTWNTSRVTDMNSMFSAAGFAFNQDISNWDVSNVTDMRGMFNGAFAFNVDISRWNTSRVTSMDFMFYQSLNFNQNISAWDTSQVTSMNNMFFSASNFNQSIGSWDVHNVTDMESMFEGATKFNQNLSAWNTSKVTNMKRMFFGDTLSTINYDNLLVGWSTKVQVSGVNFSGGNSKYSTCGGGTAGRTILNTTYNWNITDGGENASYVCSGNSAPIISRLNFTSSIDPAAGQNRTVQINFTATDADGNLNYSSATMKINKTASIKSGTCTAITVDSTTANFTCNISMQHFDAAGLWYINVTIADNSTNFATNFTEYFTYNQLLYLQATPSIFSIGAYAPNDSYQSPSSNITLDNMGNVNLTKINITAFDLANGSNAIGAGNFTANSTNAVGVALANNSNRQIPGARIDVDQEGSESNSTIFLWFKIPNVPALSYASLFEWVVTADE